MDSSSDLILSNDWDIINSSTEENKNGTEEQTGEILEKDETTKVAEKVKEPKGTGVHDIPELEGTNHNESSSSSEFDVIDETAEENHSDVPISNMEFSLSASLGSRSSVAPEVEPQLEPEQPVNLRWPMYGSFHLYPNLIQRVIIVLSILIVILSVYFSASDSAKGTINHMKDRMSVLQAENIELKNQMSSKFENNKILMALEEQIKALKNENFKLSSAMQTLVLQLEEQTAILKKEKETKIQDPYRSEIENLKEHISKLQSDNKAFDDRIELIRYSFFSYIHMIPLHYFDISSDENMEFKENVEQTENHENSSETVAESLLKVRKLLKRDLEKYNTFKETVQQRVVEVEHGNDESHTEDESQHLGYKYGQSKREEIEIIEEREKKHSEEEWKLSNEEEVEHTEEDQKHIKLSQKEQEPSHQNWKPKRDMESSWREEKPSRWEEKASRREKKASRWEEKPSKKYKKSHEREQEFFKKPPSIEKESGWSWNVLKKNLKGTIDGLPKINVPDMLSNYVDKKKVENVFESVGHYFKKAQEKTKKILNYNNEGKDHFWNFLGDLRKKWSDIKDDFFENNYRKSEDDEPQFSTDTPSQSQGPMASKKFKKPKVFETREKLPEDFTTSPEAQDWEGSSKKPKQQNEDIDAVTQSNKDTVVNWFLKRNENTEDIDTMSESDKAAVINWFLRRNKNDEEIDAMTEEDKDAVINWFLKRNKDEYIDTELHAWMAYWNQYNTPPDDE